MRKAFVLIVSVCVLLFTACGQKPVNSEEVSSPQEPSVERKNSSLTEGGDDLPAAGTEVTAQAAPENEQSTKDANSPEKPAVTDRVLPMETDIEEAATAPKQPSQSPSAPIQNKINRCKIRCQILTQHLYRNLYLNLLPAATSTPLQTPCK